MHFTLKESYCRFILVVKWQALTESKILCVTACYLPKRIESFVDPIFFHSMLDKKLFNLFLYLFANFCTIEILSYVPLWTFWILPVLVDKHIFTAYTPFFQESPTKDHFNPKDYTRENCQGMEVLSPDSFFPVPWYEASTLWSLRQSTEDWENQFKNSYTVHFYQSSWRHDEEIQRPEFYDESLYPSYVPLALKHCPLSYYSDDTF